MSFEGIRKNAILLSYDEFLIINAKLSNPKSRSRSHIRVVGGSPLDQVHPSEISIYNDASIDVFIVEVPDHNQVTISSKFAHETNVIAMTGASFKKLLEFVDDCDFVEAQYITEYHYTCTNERFNIVSHYILVFFWGLLVILSIRLIKCENQFRTHPAQKLLIFPIILKQAYSAVTLYKLKQCPWFDQVFAEYLTSLQITTQTIQQTLLLLDFLVILSGFKICRNQFHRFHIKQIVILAMIQYSIQSMFQISIDSDKIRVAIEFMLNIFNFVMLFIVTFNVIINYKTLDERIKSLTNHGDISRQLAHRIQSIRVHLVDRLRITLHSSALIRIYYLYELVFHFVIDFYVSPLEHRTKLQNDCLQLLHELVDLLLLMSLTLVLSPFVFETPQTQSALYVLCPIRLVMNQSDQLRVIRSSRLHVTE